MGGGVRRPPTPAASGNLIAYGGFCPAEGDQVAPLILFYPRAARGRQKRRSKHEATGGRKTFFLIFSFALAPELRAAFLFLLMCRASDARKRYTILDTLATLRNPFEVVTMLYI